MGKAKDENDRLRDGTLPFDPEEGTEEMPDPNASKPLDEAAPTFADAYPLAALEADEGRRLVEVASLPSWLVPENEPRPACGHGIGAHLSAVLGHGLRPGELLALGAASAGAGKTAWLMQLVDGLALRNERVLAGEGARWGRVLTPIVLASEMPASALTWRSLARWTGYPAYMFRAGQTLLERGGYEAERAREAWAAARRALQSGELAAARSWIRGIAPRAAGEAARTGAQAFADHLASLVERWREALRTKHPGFEIVPIVVLDPLQRFQSGENEVSDLNALSRELCEATTLKHWITLVTSDTNKAAAKGEKTARATDVEEGAAVFRGSYNLQHEATVALYLRRPPRWEPTEDEKRKGERHVEMVVVKQRWGYGARPWPRYVWQGPTLRFWPMTRDVAEQTHREETNRETNGNGMGASYTSTVPEGIG
jgi:hypothetical protein